MANVLLPIFYLPPISWCSVFFNSGNTVVLEQFENFPKQTFRNRTHIYGANGKLSLIIPIKHTGARVFKDVEISYAENWQKLHWKSIKTAYQSSPFFEFYEDKLQNIYAEQNKFLKDFNLKTLEVLQALLKIQIPFELSDSYHKHPAAEDLREKFSAKNEGEAQLSPYYQTFSDKMGFIKDLSVLDLICNKGPESATYINNNLFKI